MTARREAVRGRGDGAVKELGKRPRGLLSCLGLDGFSTQVLFELLMFGVPSRSSLGTAYMAFG